jgi:ATP-dependent Zn protease
MVLLALAVLAPAALAGNPPVTESYQTFQSQITAGQVHEAVFNKKPHLVHVILVNGQRQEVSYPSHQFAALTASLQSHGANVIVTHKKSTTKTTHHKLRYIAGGIVIVALIGIGALLFVRRRRYQATMAGTGA